MNKSFLVFLFIIFTGFSALAQIEAPRGERLDNPQRSMQRSGNLEEAGRQKAGVIAKKDKPPISEYRIISIEGDTTIVDTSLTIYKDYKFNYLRRDYFELLPFNNIGQSYNSLSYNFHEQYSLTPGLGARAKHFNFFEVRDIYYYRVPTPLTELYFKTAFEQGQQLDAFFTVNTHPNLNFSIAYKGLRSLGRYQHSLTSTGNFRSTINYNSTNNRYKAKAHFVSQDISNQENGGLTNLAVQQYLGEQEEFDDRALLEVNFTDAQTTLLGKRFYLNHSFQLNPEAGSDEGFNLGHKINFTDKKYRFEQTTASDLFGEAFRSTGLSDEVNLEHVYNEARLGYKRPNIGELSIKGGFAHYNYGYNSVINFENESIGNRLIGDIFSAGAEYKNSIGGLEVHLNAMANIAGDFEGNFLDASFSYNINENHFASVKFLSNSSQPNFNFLLYQSDYINYNWQNDFKNQKTNSVAIEYKSSKIANVEASYSRINNFAFFRINEDSLVRPAQYNDPLNFFKIKIGRQFNYGKFSLDNTLLFQDVLSGTEAMNLPTLVTRNSLYYRDHLFQRALFLQTGFTLKYFTDYQMNGYDPVLSEFYVQNAQEFNGFPMVDFFFNGRIRQTRIFFKLEHLNALVFGNSNFSAPGYPYRDFGVRFGLVWNFFL